MILSHFSRYSLFVTDNPLRIAIRILSVIYIQVVL